MGFVNVPYIGGNGHWYVNDIDTGVKAQGEPGENGVAPHIGADGCWYLGETSTGIKAVGKQGIQGEQGPKGEQGIQGHKGDVGESGPQGLQGIAGPQGCQGPKGDREDTGASGPQGAKGEQGDPGPVNIANNLTTTAAGYALDARQGKVLKDEVSNVNSNLKAVEVKREKTGNYSLVVNKIPEAGLVTFDLNVFGNTNNNSTMIIPSGSRPLKELTLSTLAMQPGGIKRVQCNIGVGAVVTLGSLEQDAIIIGCHFPTSWLI